jgi:hypothetical protein
VSCLIFFFRVSKSEKKKHVLSAEHKGGRDGEWALSQGAFFTFPLKIGEATINQSFTNKKRKNPMISGSLLINGRKKLFHNYLF